MPYLFQCAFAVDAATASQTKVKLDWNTGLGATDWEEVAKKENLDVMATELRKLEQMVKDIHQEMLFLKKTEEEMRNLNGMCLAPFINMVLLLTSSNFHNDRDDFCRGYERESGLVQHILAAGLRSFRGLATVAPAAVLQKEKDLVVGWIRKCRSQPCHYLGHHDVKCIILQLKVSAGRYAHYSTTGCSCSQSKLRMAGVPG